MAAVDRARIFAGSFDVDQRSARLDTEMGIVIDSAALAAQRGSPFDTSGAELACEVRLAPNGDDLLWIERIASGADKRYDVEPETDPFMRWKVEVLSALPIDWLLWRKPSCDDF